MPIGMETMEAVQNPEALREQYDKFEIEYHDEIVACTVHIEAYQEGIKKERESISLNISVLNHGQSEKRYCINEHIKFQRGIEIREFSLKAEAVSGANQNQSAKKYNMDPAAFCEEIQEAIDKIERYNGYILELHSRKEVAENALKRVSLDRKQLDEAEDRKTAFGILRNMLGM